MNRHVYDCRRSLINILCIITENAYWFRASNCKIVQTIDKILSYNCEQAGLYNQREELIFSRFVLQNSECRSGVVCWPH